MDSNERLGRRAAMARLSGLIAPAFASRSSPMPNGAALLMSVSERRVISVQGGELAKSWLGAPGSTMKPLSLLALLDARKLTGTDEFLCPGKLVLAGYHLNCSHPPTPLPMNVSRAIAYSCNCAVAHFAQRFAPGELAGFLVGTGLNSASGFSASGQDQQLQALGETRVRVTPLELAAAYRYLARRVPGQTMTPVLDGMEGAVEFGTAQSARLEHIRVAGKTGSVRTSSGQHAAWFAGFAPSRSPEVAVVVLVQGRSGGSDAAPIAARILREHFGERA